MKYRKIRKTGQLLCVLFVFCAVERYCHKKTRGFRPYKITTPFLQECRFTVGELSFDEQGELKKILSQPYTFLGDGGQGYSFVSKDGNYVLKFFKLHHVHVPAVLRQIRLFGPLQTLYSQWIEERDKDRERMLTSCMLASTHLAQETSVVHVHINPTKNLYPKLTLYDAIGAIHVIDLDKTVFAVQRKAELAFSHIKQDLAKKDRRLAERAIDDFLGFVARRCRRGVEDRDKGLKRNFGYIKGQMIEIDIGSFVLNPYVATKEGLRAEVAKKGQDLKEIIEEKYPEMVSYYQERLDQIIAEEF